MTAARSLDAVPSTTGRFGIGAGLIVTHAEEPPDLPSLRELRRLHRQKILSEPGGYCYVVFVGERSTPASEVRQEMLSLFSEMANAGCLVAVVLEASGFVAAVQRSVGTAFLRVVGNTRMRVFGDVSDAASWAVSREIGGHTDPIALAQTLLEFRERRA